MEQPELYEGQQPHKQLKKNIWSKLTTSTSLYDLVKKYLEYVKNGNAILPVSLFKQVITIFIQNCAKMLKSISFLN